MADRDRPRDRGRDRDRDHRDRQRDRDRDRDRDREREKRRDKESERDRDRRSKRSRSPEEPRSRHARSRTRSPDDRSHRRHRHRLSPSLSPARKRHRRDSPEWDDKDRHKVASDFVDGIAKEQHQGKKEKPKDAETGADGMEDDDIEMMRKLGIPVGFDSTKGKPVPGADVSGVRAVSKRQPRQYMNRRGGFNRPLPMERNR